MNVLNSFPQTPDASLPIDTPLICFSHLRWDFVLQRPQHLMQRFSQDRQVFFFRGIHSNRSSSCLPGNSPIRRYVRQGDPAKSSALVERSRAGSGA